MQGQRYNDAKKEIRSVLLTYKDSVTLEEFRRAYKDLIGERLPSRNLGYTDDIDFLKSMPDVAHVSTNEIGRTVLSGIADESSLHIKKLVSKQRRARTSNKLNSRSYRSESFNMPVKAREFHPFVPGPLRAEILELAALFPDGIALPAFVLAYRKKFNKFLSLEQGLDSLEYIINSIGELELRTSRSDKKIYYKNTVKRSEDKGSILPQTKDRNHGRNTGKENIPVFHKSGISAEVQNNFRQVLHKCPEGMLAIHFPPVYEKVTGQPFDLHKLGYNSILELVDALPEIFKRTLDPSDDKTWIILPANSPKKSYAEKQKLASENSQLSSQKGSSPPFPLKLREGVPADVAYPLLSYTKLKMPENIKLDEYFPVFASAIINPSLFWFQLQTDDICENFEALENDLGSFYNSYAATKYKMNDADVVIGAICVVQCPEDKLWYRAVIKAIPSLKFVNVLFVDYGSRDNIPRTNLRYLRNKYLGFPAAAFRAELAGLKPANNSSNWGVKAQQRFIQLCESASLMARINHIENDAFSVYLCDTSGDNEIHVNETLVREGCAEFCYENHLNYNAASEEHTTSVITNEVNHGRENNHSPKCPSTNTSYNKSPSCDSKNQEDHAVKAGNRDNFITEENALSVKRKLSFSMAKQPRDSESDNSDVQQRQICKRYVKLLKVCEKTKIHIVCWKEKLYMTAGDLTDLLWRDEDFSCIVERLRYKEINVPFVEISKEDNFDLFHQCKWYKTPDFKDTQSEISLLTLCSLEWAFNILNVFGHPSFCLRSAIQKEITNFDPQDPIWKEFTYEESQDLEGIDEEFEDKLRDLNLYDLKAKYEAFKIKRLRLQKVDNTFAAEEVKRIELHLGIVERRMKHIESIMSQFPSYS